MVARYCANKLDQRGRQIHNSPRSTEQMFRIERRCESLQGRSPGRILPEIAKDLKSPQHLGEYFRKLEDLDTRDAPRLNLVWTYYFTHPRTAFYFRIRWT